MANKRKLATAYHNLSITLEAGVEIIRAFEMIAQGQRGSLKKAFLGTRDSISKGNGVFESMNQYRKTFGHVDLMLIEAAETSGKYPDCFKLLSQWHEFQNKIMSMIKSGLIFPIFILHFALFIAPVPGLVMAQNFTMEKYLFAVLKPLIIIYVIVFGLIFLYRTFKNLKFMKSILDQIVMFIPLLGKAIWELSIARFCFAFNMLNKAGVPIMQGLPLAVGLTGNTVVERVFRGGADSVQKGNAAIEGFSSKMPIEYYNLWQVGEESGELAKTVDKIAEIASDRAEFYFTQFAKWFPKIVYAIICIWMISQIFKFYAGYFSNLGQF